MVCGWRILLEIVAIIMTTGISTLIRHFLVDYLCTSYLCKGAVDVRSYLYPAAGIKTKRSGVGSEGAERGEEFNKGAVEWYLSKMQK